MVYYDKENKNRPLNGVGAPRGGNVNALSKKNKDCKDMLEHTPTFLYLTTQFFLGQIKIS